MPEPPPARRPDETFTILSIDGGGVRGIVPALVLAALEERLPGGLHQYFDLMIGTSIGAYLAAMLAARAAPGSPLPRANAARAIERMEAEFPRIFSAQTPLSAIPADTFIPPRLRAMFGNVSELWRPPHNTDALREEIRASLCYPDEGGDPCLDDTLTELMIPSYDLRRRMPVIFRSAARGQAEGTCTLPLHLAVAASTAAPSLFRPLALELSGADTAYVDLIQSEEHLAFIELPGLPASHETLEGDYVLIDGGLFLNNPGWYGLLEGLARGYRPDQIYILSLGCGYPLREAAPRATLENLEGIASWALKLGTLSLVTVTIDAQSTLVAESLGKLFGGPSFTHAQYDRIQFPLPQSCEALDDPDELPAIRALLEPALRQQDQAVRLLDAVAGKLRARAAAR